MGKLYLNFLRRVRISKPHLQEWGFFVFKKFFEKILKRWLNVKVNQVKESLMLVKSVYERRHWWLHRGVGWNSHTDLKRGVAQSRIIVRCTTTIMWNRPTPILTVWVKVPLSSKYRVVYQLVRLPHLGCGGCEFESHLLYKNIGVWASLAEAASLGNQWRCTVGIVREFESHYPDCVVSIFGNASHCGWEE